jgi:hypothetical protein
MIAERIQRCGPAADPIAYADAVMELFDEEVTVEGRSPRSGVWWANAPRADAHRYVMRTLPAAVGDESNDLKSSVVQPTQE